MLDRIFGGDGFVAQTRALDAASLRQQTIAHNLANVNTPGFKRQDVTFERQLSHALLEHRTARNADDHPVDRVRPQIVTPSNSSLRADGNNVDMEAENVNSAINTLKYEALTQMVGGYFSGLKAAISGR
jgi:flagellar basal-body rod protein FlgB